MLLTDKLNIFLIYFGTQFGIEAKLTALVADATPLNCVNGQKSLKCMVFYVFTTVCNEVLMIVLVVAT